MKFFYIIIAVGVLSGLFYLALKLLGRLVLGESPKSETPLKPMAQKIEAKHSSESNKSWTHFIQVTVIAVVVGIFSVSRINGCTEMVREWKASDARTAAYEANPDNYWWVKRINENGEWIDWAFGVKREENSDGRIVMSWKNSNGRTLNASSMPGQNGSWINSKGEKLWFKIDSSSPKLIAGTYESAKGFNQEFRFERTDSLIQK